jgi:L-seryl-tRNA(Ser) seleniumtransferase
MNNRNIYERLGVPTIINGKGTSTRVSGGIMPAEVADAMREATQACVDMATLQARASEVIADCTGAEAGYVTSGAAAALLLGTAACVTGLDPGRMNRLPDTRRMRNRVVIVRSQRNLYDHAVRAVGVKLVEVGIADRYSGAGVRDASAWEIADAIDERTACVFYVAQTQSQPPLSEVVAVAHAAGVPVLVDAAAQLPPVSNLRRFIDEGADLVAFSGGKAVLGPQGSGVLCGRRDLIAAAALNNLDHDILWEQWNPPPTLIDKSTISGLPQHGIGRACKVGKEQVVGLMVALQMFDEAEVTRRNAHCTARLDEVQAALSADLPVVCERVTVSASAEPRLRLLIGDSSPLNALELVIGLQNGEPPIQLDPIDAHRGIVTVVPTALREGEGSTIAARIAELLSQ